MGRLINAVTLSLLAALGIWGAGPAQAADLTVYLNQATESGVRQLAAGFEKATGYKVDVSFQGGANLNQKIVSDAPGDLVSLGLDQFADYIKQGKVVAGSVVEYASGVKHRGRREGWARAVRHQQPRSLQERDAQRQHDRPYQRRHRPVQHQAVPEAWVTNDQVKGKIKLVQGWLVAEAAAGSEVEIGIQQTNVIQPVAGSQYLGPLPEELMEYGRVGVGLLSVSRNPQAATAFMRAM